MTGGIHSPKGTEGAPEGGRSLARGNTKMSFEQVLKKGGMQRAFRKQSIYRLLDRRRKNTLLQALRNARRHPTDIPVVRNLSRKADRTVDKQIRPGEPRQNALESAKFRIPILPRLHRRQALVGPGPIFLVGFADAKKRQLNQVSAGKPPKSPRGLRAFERGVGRGPVLGAPRI